MELSYPGQTHASINSHVGEVAVNKRTHPRLLRYIGATLHTLQKATLYFVSLLGPVLLLHQFSWMPVAAQLGLAILGYGVAGVTFLSLLILSHRMVFGPVRATGRTKMSSADGRRWYSAALSASILVHSPFRPMTSGMSLFAACYYRGMGARMPDSVLLGARSRITDPWFLELGENVTIGADAVILGHLGHGDEVFLGRVVIGDGAIVGMRAVVFPDVRIGKHARVGAGAIVVRGTTIPDGETWTGVPARRSSPKSQARKVQTT